MRGWSVRALALGAMAAGCLDPTQATFEITTDVACGPEGRADGALLEVGLMVGSADVLREGELQGTTRACTQGDEVHRVGDIVVYPADDATEARLMVVAGLDDARAEDCVAFARGDEASSFASSCIVARRRVAFVDHEDLQVPVFLDERCAGVACDEDTTCVRRDDEATCVDAVVECRGGACSIGGEGGGAGVTTSQGSGGGGGQGGQGGQGDQGGGGATGGGTGDGGAGEGGGDVLIERVEVDGFIERVAAISGAAGEAGPLVVVQGDAAGDAIARVDEGLLVSFLPPGTQVLGLDAREYPEEPQRLVALAPTAVHRSSGASLDAVATDVALLRDNTVVTADGTSTLRLWEPVSNEPATIALPSGATVVDTHDGVSFAAAGESLCRVLGGAFACADVVASLGDAAVDVAAGPIPTDGMEAMAVVADGGLVLARFELVDGVPTIDTQSHPPPTLDALDVVRGRLTVTDSSVDGVWLAGARDGAAFLARGVRAEGGMVWRVIDELAGEPPLVDLWVAPADGSRAWVVTDDGRLLAVTLL